MPPLIESLISIPSFSFPTMHYMKLQNGLVKQQRSLTTRDFKSAQFATFLQ